MQHKNEQAYCLHKKVSDMDPLLYEEKVMQTWDSIRELLLVEKCMGTLPRDIFESLADWIYDKGQNDALDKLAALLPLQASLILEQKVEL